MVKGWVDIMEQLVQKVRQQEEKIARLYRHPAYDYVLKDEIAVLTGEKRHRRDAP
jgi:predicted mannosyl-3-phosphoglycerate phosphatase (HAD superfamily)